MLAKKLLKRGDEVVGIDNINDYYDVNLKYGRLKELGIDAQGEAKATLPKSGEAQSGKRHGLAFLKATLSESTLGSAALAAPIPSTKYKTHKYI